MQTEALSTFRREFPDTIVLPGQDNYEQLSTAFMTAGRPAAIAQPSTVAGVQQVIGFARESGLALAVRGGGHSQAGFSTGDGVLVLDLSLLDGVELIDPARHIVRIGGGAIWGSVANALAAYGLAISSGDTKSVGVGGLLLGGGIGWKVRKYGLALDHLVGVEVVTADGAVVRASEDENADLFWALRGGGGNFGVVTAFDIAAHPTTDVFYGTLGFPIDEVSTVLPGWHAVMGKAPEELTSVIRVLPPMGPDAPRTLQIALAYDGDDPAAADRAIDPLRELGTVEADTIALSPYSEVLEALPQGGLPPGFDFVVRNGLAGKGADASIELLTEVAAGPGSPFMEIRSLGSRIAQVPSDATAFAYRDSRLMIVLAVMGPGPVVAAARPGYDAVWARLAPHIDGAYANFLSTADPADIAAIYPPTTYARLADVKRKYDPANLFHRNQNVDPA